MQRPWDDVGTLNTLYVLVVRNNYRILCLYLKKRVYSVRVVTRRNLPRHATHVIVLLWGKSLSFLW